MTVNHNNTAVLSLTFVDGETPLLTTTYHPFFSEDRDDWVHADELVPGETVRSHDGVLVLEASEPVAGVHRVYNFEVEKTHTYYAGDDDAWVHNGCAVDIARHAAQGWKNLQCKACAASIEQALKGGGHNGKRLTVTVEGGGNRTFLSDTAGPRGRAISESGYHEAIEVDGLVFDNMHPNGITREAWQSGLATFPGKINIDEVGF